MMALRALGFAAGLTATLGLAQPALAATAPVTRTQSTVFAGYNFANYIAVPGAVSAIIVVPKLNCHASPPAGSSIYVGVGIQSVNTYARLYLACTPQRVARYYPSLVDKWHHKEHGERFGPSWGQDRVRGVTKRLESDGLGN